MKKKIYLVGIKGVGMAALAIYLKEKGHTVWGSDGAEIFPTDAELNENQIRIVAGFKKENITDDINLVVTTGAHEGLNNIEVSAAKEKGIEVQTLAQFVGQESKQFKTVIAVCGSHGKTTTSAMIAFVLNQMGLKSSHLVGAPKFSGLNGGGYGGDDYLVVEADEYVASPGTDNTPRFMYLEPDVIICTSVDYDHPDVFASAAAIQTAYLNFFKKLNAQTGILIYNSDDAQLVQLTQQLNIEKKFAFDLHQVEGLKLQIPGRHNLQNAAGVLKLIEVIGLNREEAIKLLGEFTGVARRFEKIFEGKATLIDDYAHHPAEIEAVIAAARDKFPNQRIIFLFQPHTYSRLAALIDEFVNALSKADRAYVLDVFASAREKQDNNINSQTLEQMAKEKGIDNITYIPSFTLNDVLKKIIKQDDIIITAGAGDIYKIHNAIIGIISKLT